MPDEEDSSAAEKVKERKREIMGYLQEMQEFGTPPEAMIQELVPGYQPGQLDSLFGGGLPTEGAAAATAVAGGPDGASNPAGCNLM